MSKLYSYTYMSLDGVIESPEQWSSLFFSDELGHDLTSRLESASAMVLGRVTYHEPARTAYLTIQAARLDVGANSMISRRAKLQA